MVSAVVSAVLSAVLTYGLVARPAEQSSDKALALAQQGHREEEAFHGALSAREDAQYDVAILQRQSEYASARAVLLKADALLINGDGGFDAYPPRYSPALVAYTQVRTLVTRFENQLPSHPECNGCKQVENFRGPRGSAGLEPGPVIDTRLSPGSGTSEPTETTPAPREPPPTARKPAPPTPLTPAHESVRAAP